ncbi:MAG: hypothetical protein D0531_00235 [Methylococcales bacterium]|nr:MAG: hypothetical protein D0531_00235 [Methylococcales bacterium]
MVSFGFLLVSFVDFRGGSESWDSILVEELGCWEVVDKLVLTGASGISTKIRCKQDKTSVSVTGRQMEHSVMVARLEESWKMVPVEAHTASVGVKRAVLPRIEYRT